MQGVSEKSLKNGEHKSPPPVHTFISVADFGGGGWTGWLATPQNSLKKSFLAGKIPVIIDNAITAEVLLEI